MVWQESQEWVMREPGWVGGSRTEEESVRKTEAVEEVSSRRGGVKGARCGWKLWFMAVR